MTNVMLPIQVIDRAIYHIGMKNRSFKIEICSLFGCDKDSKLIYLYDLCNNRFILDSYKGAYRDVKTTLDVVKAVLHNELVFYCEERSISVMPFMRELENLNIN